jgi:hypothetical protein
VVSSSSLLLIVVSGSGEPSFAVDRKPGSPSIANPRYRSHLYGRNASLDMSTLGMASIRAVSSSFTVEVEVLYTVKEMHPSAKVSVDGGLKESVEGFEKLDTSPTDDGMVEFVYEWKTGK